MGRTKDDSTELEDRPEDSHVARTDQEDFGDIFRRNTPCGTVTDHGTMFVGFAAEQGPLARMLASMAGIDGSRDALRDPADRCLLLSAITLRALGRGAVRWPRRSKR